MILKKYIHIEAKAKATSLSDGLIKNRESNFMFTFNSDKDQRKKFAFTFAFVKCK